MLPLRYRHWWLAGGLAGVVLLFVLTLLPLALGQVMRFGYLDDKKAHFIAFMLLMVWFCGVFRPARTPLVAAGLMAIGILIEGLQSLLPYRAAELADALSDGGGILTGWVLSLAGLRHWATRIEGWLPTRPGP